MDFPSRPVLHHQWVQMKIKLIHYRSLDPAKHKNSWAVPERSRSCASTPDASEQNTQALESRRSDSTPIALGE